MDEVELAKKLISFDTVSPVKDMEAFGFIEGLLQQHDIDAEIIDFGGVKNLIARTGDPEAGPRICLNGHLDVVEPGRGWDQTGPFRPLEKGGRLYGRGAADMKADLAAQIMSFIDIHEAEDFDGEMTLMIVGDEELGGFHGTMKLLEDEERFDYAIIGEPTDMDLQVGVRGIFWANIYLKGESCHASRPQQTDNITHRLPEVLDALRSMEMTYEPDEKLPEPTAPITSVETSGPHNSIPGEVRIGMDIRHLPCQDEATVREDIEEALGDAVEGLEWELELIDHGSAFLLDDDRFRDACMESLSAVRDDEPRQITSGGSSDGRFFANRGTPFIELGVNQQPGHRTDESCSVENIRRLRTAYRDIADRLSG